MCKCQEDAKNTVNTITIPVEEYAELQEKSRILEAVFQEENK